MKRATIMNQAAAASSQNSGAAEVGDLTTYSIHVQFTDSETGGTLQLQASDDASDWVDVPSSSQAVTSGKNHIWNVTGAGYRYARFTWTPDGGYVGSGKVTATFVAKEPANRQ